MPTVTSLGAGSNSPELQQLLEGLMKYDANQLQLDQLDKQEKLDTAALSAYGQVKAAIAPLQSAAKVLMAPQKLQLSRPVTVSDDSVLSATATSSAVAASYSIEVTQLAQQQKLVATGQADKTAAINTGTLTFSFGTISGGTFDAMTGKYTGATFNVVGTPLNVTIDASHNTLEGIRDAINAAGSGQVTATIINDGSGTPYRLALTSVQSGAAHSMQITVAEDGGLTTLADLLAHDPAGTQALSQRQTAQDTEFTVDGVAISKPVTQISDVIDGVTLQLNKSNVGSVVKLTVGDKDPATFITAVNSFVKAYNEFQVFNAKVTMSQAAGTDLASTAC